MKTIFGAPYFSKVNLAISELERFGNVCSEIKMPFFVCTSRSKVQNIRPQTHIKVLLQYRGLGKYIWRPNMRPVCSPDLGGWGDLHLLPWNSNCPFITFYYHFMLNSCWWEGWAEGLVIFQSIWDNVCWPYF